MPSYVRIGQVTCPSCNSNHDIVIEIPAYPGHGYVFVCPLNNIRIHLSGIPAAARTILHSIPSGCIEAADDNGSVPL